MKEERNCLNYAADMLDAAQKARQFVGSMSYEEFAADAKTVFAVIRALEILGEAAKQLPDSLTLQYSAIARNCWHA